jgi:NB-ARC domain
VRDLILQAPGRLVTLTGTGGCGKTRLALELASGLISHFEHGVWVVELAAVGDPELVPQAVVSALGVREQPGEPATTTLTRTLSKRDCLLVLDNCEHVIEVCAQVVEQLLDHCPRFRVLATSREALRITGELAWRVPSLRVPDQSGGTNDLLRSPAVRLFVERAEAALQGFLVTENAVAVGRICSRLDGLPLAIELAAARVGTLGVEQILERLDDSIRLLVGGSRAAPSRQQTLRATLDWSYGLLSEDERAVFRRLAVFAEGCCLDRLKRSAWAMACQTVTCWTCCGDWSTSRWLPCRSAKVMPGTACWSRFGNMPTSSWPQAAREMRLAGDTPCTMRISFRCWPSTPTLAVPGALPPRASLRASTPTSALLWPGPSRPGRRKPAFGWSGTSGFCGRSMAP